MTKTTTITGFTASVVFMFDSDNVVNVEKGAHLMPGGDLSFFGGGGSLFGTILENFTIPDAVHDNVYNIDGQVLGLQAGVITAGEDDKVNIGSTGSVYGSIGVGSIGTHTTITNNGKIMASFIGSGGEAAGILVGGEDSKVVNNGFVSGYAGIIGGADGTQIINGKHGVIYGDFAGVALTGIGSSSSGADVEFINHGRVTGSSGIAFTSSGLTGNITIVNDGMLKGTVAFGDGNDTFDNRGGSLNKLGVIGGSGDDTLIVDDSKHFLKEAAMGGNDTVKSTVSYTLTAYVEDLFLLGKANSHGTGNSAGNEIHGNTGKNLLLGMGGDDDLYGGKGTDTMKGGSGIDTFHFVTGDGHDTVADFVSGTDKIDVSHWAGIDTFAHLKAHAADGADGLVITMGDDTLTIANLTRNHLDVGDFVFPH